MMSRRRWTALAIPIVALSGPFLALVGLSPESQAGSISSYRASSTRLTGELTITVDSLRPGLPRVHWTLTCDPDEGFHTDPRTACQHLRSLSRPFAEPGRGKICARVTYGQQRATISGTWRGRSVRTSVDRSDGCQEERWQRLRPLLDPQGPCAFAGTPGNLPTAGTCRETPSAVTG
ncbi:SSI family serine proteinase inhibitor [Actinomadura roseirufa]|uniref:SSI family serine proteinase inhibitor n=1 Tax=Actinomadura roseirufa TaxID=2094049 RepID=UPI001040EEFB|nr:SSI family serine proteinase inhibitor [Actinomadura roseirufa]